MGKLAQMIENGFGAEEHCNCAERILLGANEAYDLGLQPQALRMTAGMGGGLGVGALCGPVNAGVMLLGCMYAKDVGLNSPDMRERAARLIADFKAREGSLDCAVLREGLENPREKCDGMILQVARWLDEEIERDAP